MKGKIPAKTPNDKLEKNRQSAASLKISNAYQYIFAGILFILLLRNIAIRVRQYRAVRKYRQQALALQAASSEKGSPVPSLYQNESWFFRSLGAVDAFAGRQVGFLNNCNVFKLCLSTFIFAINVAFCLIIDTNLAYDTTVNANVARAFSRRCGRIATANFPFLFILTGRNNSVTVLTGFPYQEVRFYHKLVGIFVLLETFIHTIAYTLYYVISLNLEKLHEEYTELYFKMGIVATVAGLVMAVTSIPYFRKGWYEIFLFCHVIGAACFLFGSWYHRPIMENWVYAAVAFWAFERLSRAASHIFNVLHAHVSVRSPKLQAEATVLNGAIVLHVPSSGLWEAGQHVYISFWGKHLISKPWLYGQSHPFSIANLPSENKDDSSMRFVLRIKDGITRALANHISEVTKNTGKPAMLTVSAEGPYGRAYSTEHYENVLLVAGGSGITHVASILADVVDKAKKGESITTDVHLVWAIHHLNQSEWLGSALTELRTMASAADLNLLIDIFVTRSDSAPNSVESSRAPSPSSSSEAIDEKSISNVEGAPQILPGSGARVHYRKPDVADVMRVSIAGAAEGHSFVLACGPDSMASVVRSTATELSSSALHVVVAAFEC